MRIVAAGAIILATTFSGADASAGASRPRTPRAAVARVDAREVVFGFGDRLGELHDALSYDAEDRDPARVDRACSRVVASYPALRDALGDKGTELLVAAESMVDACRRHFAATLDVDGFEIVDGDYYTYRELSFDFAD
jgi:hypothetical protein